VIVEKADADENDEEWVDEEMKDSKQSSFQITGSQE
jgi:hypothetical protein